MKPIPEIVINLDSVQKDLKLIIRSKKDNTLFDGAESALENNEAQYQLVEGCSYDYEISEENYILKDIGQNIIQPHKIKPHLGTISPNIFVGTLEIHILKSLVMKSVK